jgi:hypothetical protein
MKGYQLGAQIESSNKQSTCYGETEKTFHFIDEMAGGGYSWMTEIF